MISAMRFTPIGLVVISTVLDNEGAYLTPALLFAFVDTIVPFAIAAEVGRVHQPTGCIQHQRHPSRHPPRWSTPCLTSSTRSVVATNSMTFGGFKWTGDFTTIDLIAASDERAERSDPGPPA